MLLFSKKHRLNIVADVFKCFTLGVYVNQSPIAKAKQMVHAYHADQPDAANARILNSFKDPGFNVRVLQLCTAAFGMGVNIPVITTCVCLCIQYNSLSS